MDVVINDRFKDNRSCEARVLSKKERGHSQRSPEMPKSTSSSFPAVPKVGLWWGGIISVVKGISYLWVEIHLSMPNINIVFHLSFSI